ncbi:CPBP family intramembrane glutamic endopeptidase [Permianibacter aggregans]|uniref:CAAX prenyl protease 2/Lysostaphin resistance protein A-like domain-containing protein n=1 Tax=Permianibacter aggregans TaxID=1510150 RepID=A0A4V3D7N3_9GAMM|nr:type II CAAX endopeptidase family protein [Permianibacter aggregans]QGX38318.1 CPBP family intramembrane metalloprotease [Permianibacter aggregans]TDQ48637.1 hypothetical protein EV696_10677 [Permianibacter aggregans]
MNNKARDLTAVALLAPAPTFGVLSALLFSESLLGSVLWAVAKAWMLLLPLCWWFWVDRQRVCISRPTVSSLLVGAGSGLLMAAAIVVAFWLVGVNDSQQQLVQNQLRDVGIVSPFIYLTMALYWCFINSIVEEYVFRWFIIEKSLPHLGRMMAVVLSATIFTIHHTVVVSFFLDLREVLLATAGVFSAALVWSWLYARYGNIWPAYISHILADVAIFVILYQILFD